MKRTLGLALGVLLLGGGIAALVAPVGDDGDADDMGHEVLERMDGTVRIAKDGRYRSLDEQPQPYLYIPIIAPPQLTISESCFTNRLYQHR